MITDRTAHDGSRPAGGLPRTSQRAAQVLVQGAELAGQEVALIPGLPMTTQSIREDLRELREAARP
jgi:hypothetical protein